MSILKQHYIGFYEPGKIISIPVDFVKNTGDNIATGVQVAVTYPAEVTYDSSALSQGAYNDVTKLWDISTLTVNQSVNGVFNFEVVDDCPAIYQFTFTVTTVTGCEKCFDDNVLCVNTYGLSCCALSGCKNTKVTLVDTLTYTALSSDDLLEINAASNVVAITLPAPADVFNTTTLRGKTFKFKVVDFTNAVSITTPSGVIIDNTNEAGAAAVYNFAAVGDYLELTSNGTNYLAH